MEASIVLAMVAMLLWARGAVAQSSHCSNVFITLSPCLNYITRNSSTPSPSCCSQLTTVVRSQPQCLCASSLGGINVNQTLALAITRCNVVSPYSSAETPKSPSEESRGTGKTKTLNFTSKFSHHFCIIASFQLINRESSRL
ncbi:protein YLS3-like [Cucurbita moschata]|uniref:Protein YLS3-like n=1 Tax=Cucurbita moschata TaxID=3662 RepID=A0A6J1H493_CUCMO|nr:protein YLS3-like [Cucurbita moschata]